jgi:hypothetical protein
VFCVVVVDVLSTRGIGVCCLNGCSVFVFDSVVVVVVVVGDCISDVGVGMDIL